MKLKYEAPKGQRFKKTCFWFGVRRKNGSSILWYDKTINQWTDQHITGHSYATHQKCNSIKAFRRMLKKLPKGVVFELDTGKVGCNVIGVGSCDNHSLAVN